MIGFLNRRFYHTSKTYFATAVRSSLLGKLRKSTGFSISNCKKALEHFPEDLQKAEEWLQNEAKKMGWSKWSKIQNRVAVHGLIGVHAEGNVGAMVEVNCETDFVAKNIEFRNLVGNVLLGCLEKTKEYEVPHNKEFQKHLLTENDLMNLDCKPFSMQELLNAAISKFNEKTVFKRAVILKANRELSVNISGLSHPIEQCPNFLQVYLGKFGALVTYKSKGEQEDNTFGPNLCQHIIGMNPLSIGAEDLKELQSLSELDNLKVNDAEEEAELKDSDETRLLFQSYLLDPNLHVHNYTRDQADILDFERFECGG